MTDTMQFWIWFLGAPVALGFIMLLMSGLKWAEFKIEEFSAHYQDRLSHWRSHATQRSRSKADHEGFLRWVAAQAGTDSRDGRIDHEMVEAQEQAGLIRILVEEEIPKAALRCVDIHRLMAKACGALHYSEIALEPECIQMRHRTVWLLTHTVEFLESYPLRLEDSRLLHNSILLRKRALPTCRRCPYILERIDEAPALCPTAELIEIKGATSARA